MIEEPVTIDFATLLDWLEGRLDSASAERTRVAVETADDRTRATVEWLRGFLAFSAAVRFDEPPPTVSESLVRNFAEWNAARNPGGTPIDTVIAELAFDSRRDLALTAVRGGDDSAHLAYQSEIGDLLIDITRRRPGYVDLKGQVLLSDATLSSTFSATISGEGPELRSVENDDLGRFSISDVPEAQCGLTARCGRVSIVADLDLRFDDTP